MTDCENHDESVTGWTRLRRALKLRPGFERWIVLAAAAAVVIIWIATVERVNFERSGAVADSQRQAMNLAIAVEQHARSTLEDVEQTLALAINEYERHGRAPALQQLFDNGAIASGLYNLFVMTDEHGNVVAASEPTAQFNVADRDYFRFHKENVSSRAFIGVPITGRATRNRIIPVSRRLDKPDGTFAGVAVASIDPAYFSDFYRRMDVGSRGLIGLVGIDGFVRARRVGDVVDSGADLRATLFYQELSKRPIGTLLGPGKLDGVRRYVTYRKLDQYPLAVEVALTEDDVLGALSDRRMAYFLAASAASLAFALAAAGFIAAARRQRRAHDQLLCNEARFRATFDQAAVGISHVALDGRILRANGKFCAMHGYTEAELRELTTADITHPDDWPKIVRLRETLREGSQSDGAPALEKRNLRKDGSSFWVSIAVALVRDGHGRPDYFATMLEDISARKDAEQRYRATFDQAAVGIALTTLDGRFLEVNGKLAEMLGCTAAELAGRSVSEFTAPEQLDAAQQAGKTFAEQQASSASMEIEYVRRDGSRGWMIRSLSPVRDASGRIDYCISVVQDITERKRADAELERSHEQFEQLVRHIPQAFWIMDVEKNELVYLSPAYENLCGLRFDSLQAASRGWVEVIHPDDRTRALAAQRSLTTELLDQRFRIVRPDGAVRWVHARGFPVSDANGRVYRVAGTLEDMTERQKLVDRLQYQAHYDALTGLPNRVLLVDRLKQTLDQAKRKKWLAAVLFLDLDRFKLVNDTLGHLFGDQLLQQVARRLSACVRAGDAVGRLGGDEFAVVLSELAQSQDAGLVAQKVIDALAAPFRLDGHEVFITASIGIATYPGDGEDADTLLKNADAAMFSAKNLGKNNYQFYTAAMNARALERLLLESNLRRALERDEFVLHLQAKADIASGAIVGCEALLRWQVPGNGLVAPAQFIPLLEESGLIVPVGEWVVRSACAQLRAWCDAGIAPVSIAVNLSAKQFQHQNICAVVEQALNDFAVDPALLEFEITESTAMHSAEEAIVTLTRLKSLGVRIAIDDFGTGYSSLSYLKRFPVDSLKLDRSFVKDLPGDADDAAIARAVIHLAHSLDLEVVAEGVETRAQLAFLADNGCDVAQGFYLSRPIPVAQFAQLLVQRRPLEHVAASIDHAGAVGD